MMSKVLRVARFEFISTLSRRSVLFVMFALPLIILGITALLNRLAMPALAGAAGEEGAAGMSNMLAELTIGSQPTTFAVGLVDEAGLIDALPDETFFRLFPSTTEAATAHQAEEINGYYVIPAGYPGNNQIQLYASSITRPTESAEERVLYHILAHALLNDPELAQLVTSPADFEVTNLATEEGGGTGGGFDGSEVFLGIGVAMLFFTTVLGSAGYLLQSLGQEKQNRVLEVLLSSIRPWEMLVGKVLGLGLIGFIQLAVWSAIVLLIFDPDGSTFQFLSLPALSVAEWLLIAVFFVGGYFVYASLFASLGALAPNPKEGNQYTFLLTLPVLIPLWFNNVFWSAPNGSPAVFMSLFPLTAPLAMPMRLVAAPNVPAWQILLSLGLIAASVVVIIFVVTRVFRSQILLSGQDLSLRHIWQSIRS